MYPLREPFGADPTLLPCDVSDPIRAADTTDTSSNSAQACLISMSSTGLLGLRIFNLSTSTPTAYFTPATYDHTLYNHPVLPYATQYSAFLKV